jgi:3-oxoacyl-[acyl-carrier-protein] synthase-1
MSKIFVTGTGIITSIGTGVKQTLDSVLQNKAGIGQLTLFDTIHKNNIPVGEVKYTDSELADIAGLSNPDKMSRTSLLGVIAVNEAIKSAGISDMHELRTGLISSTSVGGMPATETFFKKYAVDRKSGKLRDLVVHEMADSTETIAKTSGVTEFVTTISTACSSSANAIMLGARFIKSNLCDRMIVGGTNSLCLFTLNGFNSLMILDKTGCKPFDDQRQGLTLGEGAGYLILESEQSINKTGKKVLCELKGYANTCDAYHQTASSPEGIGAYLAMSQALGMAGLIPEDVSYINAHGTGTPNNDLSEGIAIEKLFGNKVPSVSSTKSFTGHTLGAAGGIEAVLSVLSVTEKIVYPNLRFKTKMKELNFLPVTELVKGINIDNVLSNSFGFGGNNTCLIFSKF